MPYEVTVDHPSIGEGTDLVIQGLGTFKNGTTTTVSVEQVNRYRSAHSVVDIIDEPQEDGSVNRTHKPRLGPHPAEQEIFGVKIVKVDKKDESKDDGEEGE